MDFNKMRVLVLGNGESGLGAEYALKKLGAKVTVVSSDGLPKGTDKSDLVVVSPGIRPDHPIFEYSRAKGLPVIGETGLGAMINRAPVIGVTGTNGKTTVVGMLGSIYSATCITAAVCGNIGRSFARTVADKQYDRVILELSSFQLLHSAPLKVHIACLLNVSPDHIDYHGSYAEYIAAKLHITDGQGPDDYFLIPADFDAGAISVSSNVMREGKDFKIMDGYLTVCGRHIVQVSELAVSGAHNLKNALFATAAAYFDGIEDAAIAEGLRGFHTGAHRISFVGEYNGTCFYNDSKGTNVSATLAAAECMNGSTALIAGGSDKACDYAELFTRLPAYVTAIFLTGANAEKMAEAAQASGRRNVIVCATLGDCVRLSSRGGYDNVLFSPASASFDRYSNYVERGEVFEREVKNLFSVEN